MDGIQIPDDLMVGHALTHIAWYVRDGYLPLAERHYENLEHYGVPPTLISWIRQHIDWTLCEALRDKHMQEATLVIEIDKLNRCAMHLEDVVRHDSTQNVIQHFFEQSLQVNECTVLYEHHGVLHAGVRSLSARDGALLGLCKDICTTLHIELINNELTPAQLEALMKSTHAVILDNACGIYDAPCTDNQDRANKELNAYLNKCKSLLNLALSKKR